MNKKLVALVINIANELNEQLENKIPVELGINAPLYGCEGSVDSLGLVSLIVDVEQGIEDEFGISLVLADEKAMSQKRSPFRTIGTLVDYADRLIHSEE